MCRVKSVIVARITQIINGLYLGFGTMITNRQCLLPFKELPA
jgi:hypothetical protein